MRLETIGCLSPFVWQDRTFSGSRIGLLYLAVLASERFARKNLSRKEAVNLSHWADRQVNGLFANPRSDVIS